MSVLPVGFGSSGSTTYQIANSIRLDGVDDYLSRTFGTPTSNTIWTWSGWVKIGTLGTTRTLFGGSGTNYGSFGIESNDKITFWTNAGGTAAASTAVYRDPTAHGHLCVVSNGTTIKAYWNGVEVLSYTGTITNINSAITHQIGRFGGLSYYAGLYLSDIYFIDGQALTPSSFGELNADNVWVPKAYTGSYGNNGFHLDFSDGTSTTTLGYDAAGSNDWTLSGMTRAAGVNECWMVDTPTDNFAVLNPLDVWTTVNGTLGYGNLNVASSTTLHTVRRSMPLPTSGKLYGEVDSQTTTTSAPLLIAFGLCLTSGGVGGYGTTGSWSVKNLDVKTLWNETTNASGNFGGAFTSGTYMRWAYDAATRYLWIGDQSNWYNSTGGTTGDPTAGTNPTFTCSAGDLHFFIDVYGASVTASVNFGQRATATPPTGFLPLSTANLPAVAIPDPSLHFDVVLDSGANIKTASEAVYTSFLEWIKDRANSNNHQLIDSVRGTSAVLQSNSTGAETTYSAPAGNSVGWLWKANGAGVSNTAGSITSTVSANTTAGFSIVTFTMPGSNIASTVGHGLGSSPKFIITFSRSVGSSHTTYHASLGATKALMLNNTNASDTSQKYWNNTEPTSAVFSIMQTGVAWWDLSSTQVAYCFAEVSGYSKAGSFTGNNNSDGVYIHLGFRARFFLVKCHNSTSPWYIYDSARSTYNVTKETLQAESSGSENTTLRDLDFTAFGVKMRTSNDPNGNGASNQYIYFAIAEHPNGSNVSPAPAR